MGEFLSSLEYYLLYIPNKGASTSVTFIKFKQSILARAFKALTKAQIIQMTSLLLTSKKKNISGYWVEGISDILHLGTWLTCLIPREQRSRGEGRLYHDRWPDGLPPSGHRYSPHSVLYCRSFWQKTQIGFYFHHVMSRDRCFCGKRALTTKIYF